MGQQRSSEENTDLVVINVGPKPLNQAEAAIDLHWRHWVRTGRPASGGRRFLGRNASRERHLRGARRDYVRVSASRSMNAFATSLTCDE
jgi:hypothetical protein